MSSARPPKSLKVLSLLTLLSLSRIASAQISGLFPDYLAGCLKGCQALWSANYDCAQAGRTSMDCLCQSSWAEQFYEGGTCTCTSDFDAQEFKNWFEGTNGCGVYVEERIRESLTATSTITPSSRTTSRESSTTEESTTDSESSTRTRPTTSAPPRTTSARTTETDSLTETTVTSGGSTFTTRVPTRTRESGETTSGPSIATSTEADQGFITEENKKWVIPTIAVGGLVIAGAIGFAIAYFFFGCCRRKRRGNYTPANPAGGAGLLGPAITSKKKKSWFAALPFFRRKKSSASINSKYSGDMTFIEEHGYHDTSYQGAGGNYPLYTPYQHGAPLPPIDEVQSIADSTRGPRDRGIPLDDDDSDFNFHMSGVSGYTPVGSGTAPLPGGMPMPMPAPAAAYGPRLPYSTAAAPANGAGIIGAAMTTGPTQRSRDASPPENFQNRYEDLTNRRNSADRRMFTPVTPQGSVRNPSGISIPRKEVPSPAVSPIAGGRPETRAVSPPVSTISSISANSSGWGGGAGRLAGRGSGNKTGFPQAPPPVGSGYMPRGEYVEDFR